MGGEIWFEEGGGHFSGDETGDGTDEEGELGGIDRLGGRALAWFGLSRFRDEGKREAEGGGDTY